MTSSPLLSASSSTSLIKDIDTENFMEFRGGGREWRMCY